MSLLLSFFQRSIYVIDSLNERVGRFVSWLVLALVLVTFCIVVLRYLFDLSWVMMQESMIYLHGLIFMLGAAYTLKHEGHVRVDIVYQRCTPTVKAWIDLLGTLFLLLPVVGFILWSSWDYVMNSWDILEASRNSGGLPFVYLLKTCLLLMSGLLLLQGLSLLMSKVIYLIETGVKHG
ncbi:MAG: TRAP transporter small permease subunit [Methyloprofundus sp.]|nr:TRAP transporter small permease subunit [Methyloprofundus sp.]